MLTMPEEHAVSHTCPDHVRVTEVITSHVPVPDALGPCNVLVVLGLWFGGRQLTFRNCSRLANVSSRETRIVQCRREETEVGRDVDDGLFIV
jgi:hypothetical protein